VEETCEGWSQSQDIARLLFVYLAFNAKQTAPLLRYFVGVVPDATGIKPEHTFGIFVKGSNWKTRPCRWFLQVLTCAAAALPGPTRDVT